MSATPADNAVVAHAAIRPCSAAILPSVEGAYLAVLVITFVGLGVACCYVAYKLLVR
jgi:hypothetical protein